mgnify:FL=1|tara:strand:+ start:1457 stop:2008 length:552 start_codon:yes stop_codon:yes gene_type:complete
MNYFIDIRIIPDTEMRDNLLMNSVYTKLHKVLVGRAATDIGVSFPQWKVLLGGVLRIHGTMDSLTLQEQSNWRGELADYCNVSEITPVPANCQYRTISRKQPTMTQAKLNRLLKRGSITEVEVKQYKAKMFMKGLHSPYLELQSGSNGHKYRRYIEFGELQATPKAGRFDPFGLSKTAAVPWF